MAIHKKWRQTYFSTPSSLTHSAYPFWSGALFNRGRNKADKVDIDLSHSNLAPGLLCADGQYRQIVTVEDAVRGGCNLFDLDQLRMEYSPDEYQNLLMCEFVDDLASVFPLSELQACMVDSWEVWTDFHALALRPFGWREVWIGYDPAKGTQNGDSAGCVVVAPPAVPGGKFRILERHQWRGMDFRARADAIKKLTEQYNVTYIGIDSTGVGHGVYENVKAFFLPSGSLSTTPTLKTPWYSRPTTLSVTAAWNLTPDTPTLRSHSWQSVAPPPPAATARPMKPAAAKKPAMPIWPGQQCTHCLTNRCRASPPMPAILWRFFDGKE